MNISLTFFTSFISLSIREGNSLSIQRGMKLDDFGHEKLAGVDIYNRINEVFCNSLILKKKITV